MTIFGAKRQILMNNPRVQSQAAQNLDVKKGLDLSSSEVRNYNDAGSILSAEQI